MSTPTEPEDDLPTFRGEDWSIGAWATLFRDLYLAFDRRTLGFARIVIGYLLIVDLWHRRVAWHHLFSDIGVLPTHVGLARPQAVGAFSIFNAFSTPGELTILWWLMLAVAVCLLAGYRTKIAQILALVLFVGMNGRVLLVENGGYVVENLLLMWTAFLPLGDRFSVDAMIASMKRRRESGAEDLNDRSDLIDPEKTRPHVSAVGLALFLQLAAIYFFNVVHKTGNVWKNGTAVHYVLHIDRMTTPIVAVIREHLPGFAIIFMTKAALAFEAALPVALLAPVGRVWARRVAILLMNMLHIGFGATMVLGPFAWSCCAFSTLLFGREDWDLAAATMRRPHRARVVVFDPRSGGALLACRLLARLDRFELLTFTEEEGVPLGIAVRRPSDRGALVERTRTALYRRAEGKVRRPSDRGALVERTAALADIVAALPLGPLVAWIGRLPVVRHLSDAAIAAIERRDLSRLFGLRAPPPAPAPPSASALANLGRLAVTAACEAMIVIMLVASLNQGAVELWAISNRVKVTHFEPLRTLTTKFRFGQGWFMFAPNAPLEDGTIVVEAITVDGRHIDPFTGREPDFDLSGARSLRLTQIWCDYFNRMQLPQNVGYREAMKDYMFRLPERTGKPRDAIVSGDVYWVKDLHPRWNETKPWGYERSKLFSFDSAAPEPKVDN